MANDTLRLALQPRTVIGKNVKKLRAAGITPIGICGKGIEPYQAQVEAKEFLKVIGKAGYTTMIEISMPGKKKQAAFLQELQRHPITTIVLHADLRVVDINQPLEVEIPVVAQGENPLVEKGQAILNLALTSINVRALPANIPHQIEFDVASLVEIDQHIYVRDLNIPGDVEVLVDGETLVAILSHPRVEAAEPEATEGEAAKDEE